jgi:type I restriction enzyme, S subunit
VSSPWPMVPLREVLKLQIDGVKVDRSETYRFAGVYGFGRGLFARGQLSGSDTTYKIFNRLHTDDIVISQPKAWEGAIARVTESFDGWFLSPVFPTFRPIEDKILPKYLEWFLKRRAVWNELHFKSKGIGARRESVSPAQFLSVELPLAPLTEQGRLVERIDALAAKIREATSARDESGKAASVLSDRVLADLAAELARHHVCAPLGALLKEAGYGTSIKCSAERDDAATPVLRIPNVASETISLDDLKYGRLEKNEVETFRLADGDILIVRTNGSVNLVGRSAVVPQLLEPTAFASYLIRIKCDGRRIQPDFLQLMLRHLRASGKLVDFARTTAGQYNVSLGRLRKAIVPVPDLQTQERSVKRMQHFHDRIGPLSEEQKGLRLELDAMLPAILDRAFRGEL